MILSHYEGAKEETYGISVLVASDETIVSDVEARSPAIGHLSFAAPPTVTGSNDTDVLEEQGGAFEEERTES